MSKCKISLKKVKHVLWSTQLKMTTDVLEHLNYIDKLEQVDRKVNMYVYIQVIWWYVDFSNKIIMLFPALLSNQVSLTISNWYYG